MNLDTQHSRVHSIVAAPGNNLKRPLKRDRGSTILSLVFASCSSLPPTSLRQRAQGSRGGQADLGQPIAAILSDGVPLKSVGYRVSRALASVSYVSRSRQDSTYDVSCTSRSSLRTHVTCSCANRWLLHHPCPSSHTPRVASSNALLPTSFFVYTHMPLF